MVVPHPIPYQGSKRKLAGAILRYFPTQIHRLIEPFAGSGAVTIAAAAQGKAKRFILNDSNTSLMALWGEILQNPYGLGAAYQTLWQQQHGQEKEFYFSVRERFNQHCDPADFLFLLARCVKAAVRYNAKGEFNQSADNRRKGTRPATLQDHICRTAQLLVGRTTLSNRDYTCVLQELTPADLIYLDPPYQGVGRGGDPRYSHHVTADALFGVLEELVKRQSAFILSYDGKTGEKTYGAEPPTALGMMRVELNAGRSSQATLLGEHKITYETLYLSPALCERLKHG